MKTCMECGDKIVGREDKKFCSDGCRNNYNNKINKDSNNFMRNINNRLRRNYRILSDLAVNGKTYASRRKLISRGFDFEHFTSLQTTKKGKTCHFLYDLGYTVSGRERYLLLRKETTIAKQTT